MKKTLVVVLIVALVAAFFMGCQKAEEPAAEPMEQEPAAVEEVTESEPSVEGYEIAMITDAGEIDDKSFNQGTWEGIKDYAVANDISYKYYKPTEVSTDAYVSAIDLAVKGGAKVVVTPGFLFEPAIFVAQDKYPDTSFILLDGTPHTEDYAEFRIESNVYSIFYAEQESGFLAGYAAVKEGYTKLGFMGGMAVPAVIRFGYGFLQGAEYAAEEMGVDAIEVKYHYTGDFAATPKNQTTAATWYSDGVEVIFAAGGKVGNSVMAAAEAAGAKVIGVDVDQSAESETVITSAKKELAVSVQAGLQSYYDGAFKGGVSETLDITVGAIGLPTDFSRFSTFTEADYDAIYAKLLNDEDGLRTSMIKDADADGNAVETNDLGLSIVSVTVVD